MNETSRFSVKLKSVVSTTPSGMTRRGNCVLRTTASWPTIELTDSPVASWKNPNSTMLKSRNTG